MGNTYETMSAIERLRAEYVSMEDLCDFLGIAKKRCLDLISLHKKDKQFMPAIKASAGKYYFRYTDVRRYLEARVSSSETLKNKEELNSV